MARSPAVAARSSLQSLTLPTLASEVPSTTLFPFYVYYIYAARYSLYRDEIHDDLVACVGMDIAEKKNTYNIITLTNVAKHVDLNPKHIDFCVKHSYR